MSIEVDTERLTREALGIGTAIGKIDGGMVYSQGDVPDETKLQRCLKKCGGKPTECDINDFTIYNNGKARPEFIITFDSEPELIICIEYKRSPKKHISDGLNKPKDFAVDGVLYYAKYLKEEFNVIAIAISGTTKETLKVNTYEWHKGRETYQEINKAKDCVLEVKNYLKLYKGEKIQKKFSLEEIRTLAFKMHETLREIKITEKQKPIFIAGLLIALIDDGFSKNYQNITDFDLLVGAVINAINRVLDASDVRQEKIADIKQQFEIIKRNPKLKDIPLANKGSLRWYLEELEIKIKPMMDYTENTLDALGVFYHEFVKYSGGDGSGLGIILTPQHLTEFMCEVAGVNKNSRVVDICCGSGSFLVSTMGMMFKNASPNEIERIRKEQLYGVELDSDLYTLSVTNMIVRKDGKSNIYNTDCFKEDITEKLKSKNINIGLINPPYSQKDKSELEFVEHLLDILTPNGKACVVVPMSCAIGTKFKAERERLFKKHTLKAVFSMPDDIFYPTGTNVCVMLWEAHTPHDEKVPTFFAYCKDDGFIKKKKLGRVDANNRWEGIKEEWLRLFRASEVKDGVSAKQCVSVTDEWLCEAYMKTDYSKLTQDDFEKTVLDYFSFLVKSGGH